VKFANLPTADYVSAFTAGGTIAASWDRGEFYRRGYQMGTEHAGKGIDVQLGPVVGPLGRNPKGGRNWEGFSPDPVLSGIAIAETVRGIQDAGVIACTKVCFAFNTADLLNLEYIANITLAFHYERARAFPLSWIV
jgi:beta-glucosidase-like glycosyl hydrolase